MYAYYVLTEYENNTLAFLSKKAPFDETSLIIDIVNWCRNEAILLPEAFGLSFLISNMNFNNFAAVKILNLPKVENPTILTALIACSLGKMIREYEGGELIKKIKAKASLELETSIGRPSSKDTQEFFLHTDLSYTVEPPPYILMHSISNPPNCGGKNTLCSLDETLKVLSQAAYTNLHKPEFIFSVPEYASLHDSLVCSILSKKHNFESIRFRRDGLRTLTKNALKAVEELLSVINSCTREVFLEKNSALLIDNRRCLHGRLGILPQSRGFVQRYFNQAYITNETILL